MPEVEKKEGSALATTVQELVVPSPNTQIQRMRDGDLMKRVASGCEQAVKELEDRFGSLIDKLARDYLKPQGYADSKDVQQDILIKLWRSAHKFNPEKAQLITWVLLITKRHCIDVFRRGHVAERSLETLKSTLEDRSKGRDSAAEDPSFLLVREEDSRNTREEMAAVTPHIDEVLTPQRSEIIYLHYGRGVSQRNLSNAMQLPLGTVKSEIFRGLGKVKEKKIA